MNPAPTSSSSGSGSVEAPIITFNPAIVPTSAFNEIHGDRSMNSNGRNSPQQRGAGKQGFLSGEGEAVVVDTPSAVVVTPRRGAEESSERSGAVAAAELAFLFGSRHSGATCTTSSHGQLSDQVAAGSNDGRIIVSYVGAWNAVNCPSTHPGIEKGLAEYTAAWEAVEVKAAAAAASCEERSLTSSTNTTPESTIASYLKQRTNLVNQLLVTKLIKRDMKLYYKEVCGTAVVALQGVLGEGGMAAAAAASTSSLPRHIEDLLSSDIFEHTTPPPTAAAGMIYNSKLHYVCRLPPGVEFWVLGSFETRPKGVHAPVVLFTDICSALHAWKCLHVLRLPPSRAPLPLRLPQTPSLLLHLATMVVPQFLFMSAESSLLCPPQLLRRVAPDNQLFKSLTGGVGGQGHHRSLFTWDALLAAFDRLRVVLREASLLHTSRGSSPSSSPTPKTTVASLGDDAHGGCSSSSLERYLNEGVVECMRRRDNPLLACKNGLFRTKAEFMLGGEGSSSSPLHLPNRYYSVNNGSTTDGGANGSSSSPPQSISLEGGGDPMVLCEIGCRVLAEWVRECCCLGGGGGGGGKEEAGAVFHWLSTQCPLLASQREAEKAAENGDDDDANANNTPSSFYLSEFDAALKYAVDHTLQRVAAATTPNNTSSPSSPLLPLIALVGYYSSTGPLETTTLLGSK